MTLKYELEIDDWFVRPLTAGEPSDGNGLGFFREDGYFYCVDPEHDPLASQVENREEMIAEAKRRSGNSWAVLAI